MSGVKKQGEKEKAQQNGGTSAVAAAARPDGEEVTLAGLRDEMNRQFQGINTQFQGINTQFQGINTQFQGINTKLDKLVVATPAAGIPDSGFLVGANDHQLQHAVLVMGGSMTWSILQRDGVFYAVSALHCALALRPEGDNPEKLFINVPRVLCGLAESVGFVLPDSPEEVGTVENPMDKLENTRLVAAGDSLISGDIVFLKLNENPLLNSVDWIDQPFKQYVEPEQAHIARPNTVCGYSHSQNVTGANCVVHNEDTSNRFFAFMKQTGEKGNSGTLMFLTTRDSLASADAIDHVPIGVFYGLLTSPKGRVEERGAICPLVPFARVTWVECKIWETSVRYYKDFGTNSSYEKKGLSVNKCNISVAYPNKDGTLSFSHRVPELSEEKKRHLSFAGVAAATAVAAAIMLQNLSRRGKS